MLLEQKVNDRLRRGRVAHGVVLLVVGAYENCEQLQAVVLGRAGRRILVEEGVQLRYCGVIFVLRTQETWSRRIESGRHSPD
jgi:hypothetical protein